MSFHSATDLEVLRLFLHCLDELSERFDPRVKFLAIGRPQHDLFFSADLECEAERFACFLLRLWLHAQGAKRDQPRRVAKVLRLKDKDADVGKNVEAALPVIVIKHLRPEGHKAVLFLQ